MNIVIFICIFLLGTIIGSFLNVVIFRFNTGKSIINSRSICMTCNKNLRWYELIPLFSFLIQSGKCRRCAEKISHQYPLVEFITGVIFVLITYHFLPIIDFSLRSYFFLLIIFMLIFSLLIVISVYDLRHKIIPDKLVYFYIVVSFLSIFVNHTSLGPLFIWPTWSYIIAGPLLAAPFALLWLVSHGKWMGLGDAKLMLGIGWMLGLAYGLSSMILSFWVGSIVGLLVILFSKSKVSLKTEIPFAPFLIVSSLIVFIFDLDIFSIISFFNF